VKVSSPSRKPEPVRHAVESAIKAVKVSSSVAQGLVHSAVKTVAPPVQAVVKTVKNVLTSPPPVHHKEEYLGGGKRRRDESDDEEDEDDDEDSEDDDSEDDSIVVSDNEIEVEDGDIPDDDSNLQAAAAILQEEAKRIVGTLDSKVVGGRTLRARPKPNLEAAERARIVIEAHQADEINEMYKLMNKWKAQNPTLTFPERKHLSYDKVKEINKGVKVQLSLCPSSDEEDSGDEDDDDDEDATIESESENEGDDSEDSSEEE
jgi:hypothetical protein